MSLVMVRMVKLVNIQSAGLELHLEPRTIANLPLEQAHDLNRAGYLEIIGGAPKTAQVGIITTGVPAIMPSPAPIAYANDVSRQGIAALIVNYNMPERTDKLVEAIKASQTDCEIIVIDNGSDICQPSKYTSLRLAANVQTCNGWLMGLHYLDALAEVRGYRPFAYWFIITSAEFGAGDPLTPLVELLQRDNRAVGVHPALTADSTTAWEHLKTTGKNTPRRTWMLDNIASLYRADWFDSIGRFDPDLTYAWGIDLETSWKARKAGRSLYVHEGTSVRKVTDVGYQMKRMNASAEERRQKAGANMAEVLSVRYGPDWNARMRTEYLEHIGQANRLVSVIVPTYNRPELLKRALDSLKAQTYSNYEAVVVNDGGVDVSEIVKVYPFARYLTHKNNLGLPAARNTGLKASKGALIAYLDDDDWYYPAHLETLANTCQNARVAYTDADGVTSSGTELYTSRDYSRAELLVHNLTPVCCVMHERSLLDEVGYFDETLKNHEDWDLWLRLAKVTDFIHIPVVTCAIDRTRETMNSNRPAMEAGFELVRSRYAQ